MLLLTYRTVPRERAGSGLGLLSVFPVMRVKRTGQLRARVQDGFPSAVMQEDMLREGARGQKALTAFS